MTFMRKLSALSSLLLATVILHAQTGTQTAQGIGSVLGLAQYDIVLSGGASSALTGLPPSSTVGAILASAGASAYPAYDASITVISGTLNAATALTTGTSPGWTAGTAGFFACAEGTPPTGASSSGGWYCDSTAHELKAATGGTSNFGILERQMPGAIATTGLTAAVTTATLCAASAGACNVAGQYRVDINIYGSGTACSSVTAGGVTTSLTWTDPNSISHAAVVIPMMSQSSATAVSLVSSAPTVPAETALANEGGSGSYVVTLNGSTALQYAVAYTACTTGTLTYNIRATVTRLQ